MATAGENGSAQGPTAPADQAGGDLRRQAVRGVLWSAIEKWSVRLSTLVGFIVLSNLLSVRAFGVVALASTFITVLTTVADAGFSAYLLQAQRITRATTSTAFYTTAALALVLAGLLAGLAVPISDALDTPALAPVLPALAFALVASGLSSVPAMLLRKDLRFKELALRNVSSTVVSVAVAVVLALLGAGVWALVAQTVVRNLVALVVLWRTSDFRPARVFDRGEARAMTRYGLQSLGVSLGTTLRSQGEIFFLGALAGTAALGYWTVASRLVNVLIDVCTSIITSVASPVYARVQGDPKRLARVLGASTAMGSLIIVPVLVLMSLTSRQVVPVVFGHHWLPAAAAASVLAMRALVRAISGFNGTLLLATGHPSAELIVTTVTLVLQVGVVILLAPRTDLVGLALALTACQFTSVPIRIVLVRRFFGTPLSTYASSAAVLLAGGLAAGVVVVAQSLLQLPGIPYAAMAMVLGSAVYLGVTLGVARPLVQEAIGTVRGVLVRRRAPLSAPRT